MSAEASPLVVRSPVASPPLWLRLRRSQPFTLSVLMCCLALLWVSPFIWMLATAFSATTFGEDMASLLPRLPLTLDNFRDAWASADWLSLYANTLIFTFGTFFVQLLTITTVSITYHWNEYLWPLMMLNDPDKQVLTVGLVSFAMGAESGGQWGTIGAGTLMVCLPLMLAFILFQKQFLRSFGFSGIK